MTTTVTVGILTHHRPVSLAGLLDVVLTQAAAVADHRVEVLVVDNDPAGSARLVAEARQGVRYVVEAAPGIAAARNRVLHETCDEDLLVFVDDDERPRHGWLRALLDTRARYGAHLVAGTVVSVFEQAAPPRLLEAGFFDRRRLTTGTPITVAATNNLLLDRRWLAEAALRFDPRFGLSGGEDTLLTRQMARLGAVMVWCAEAVVEDLVPTDRATMAWVLRRAYSSGNSDVAVDVQLRRGHVARGLARVRGLSRGGLRVAGGAVRWLTGVVVRRRRLRDRGRKAVARGLGMAAGAVGSLYLEYGRDTAAR